MQSRNEESVTPQMLMNYCSSYLSPLALLARADGNRSPTKSEGPCFLNSMRFPGTMMQVVNCPESALNPMGWYISGMLSNYYHHIYMK